MNNKVLVAICGCVLLVVATLFVITNLTVNQSEPAGSDIIESSLSNATETLTTEESVKSDVGIQPFLIIDAPVPCKNGERYVAAKNKCERVI